MGGDGLRIWFATVTFWFSSRDALKHASSHAGATVLLYRAFAACLLLPPQARRSREHPSALVFLPRVWKILYQRVLSPLYPSTHILRHAPNSAQARIVACAYTRSRTLSFLPAEKVLFVLLRGRTLGMVVPLAAFAALPTALHYLPPPAASCVAAGIQLAWFTAGNVRTCVLMAPFPCGTLAWRAAAAPRAYAASLHRTAHLHHYHTPAGSAGSPRMAGGHGGALPCCCHGLARCTARGALYCAFSASPPAITARSCFRTPLLHPTDDRRSFHVRANFCAGYGAAGSGERHRFGRRTVGPVVVSSQRDNMRAWFLHIPAARIYLLFLCFSSADKNRNVGRQTSGTPGLFAWANGRTRRQPCARPPTHAFRAAASAASALRRAIAAPA